MQRPLHGSCPLYSRSAGCQLGASNKGKCGGARSRGLQGPQTELCAEQAEKLLESSESRSNMV